MGLEQKHQEQRKHPGGHLTQNAVPAGYTEVGRDGKRRGEGLVVVKAESPGSIANWKKSWLRILVSENKTTVAKHLISKYVKFCHEKSIRAILMISSGQSYHRTK